MTEAMRQAVLRESEFAVNSVRLAVGAPAERVSLRANKDAAARISGALGLPLPGAPGETSRDSQLLAFWLGPDEWMLIAEEERGLQASLAEIDDAVFSAVDISHRNIAIHVSGRRAENVLNAGCPLDLSLPAFGVHRATRTVLGKAEIVLYREAEAQFRVECWRSFADYVWRFMVEAAKCA